MDFSPLSIGLWAGLVMAPCVLGLGIAWRLLSFPDITIEGSFLIGAAAFAVALRAGTSEPIALVLAGCAGAILGLVTAILNAAFGINRFLAGILVTTMAYSATLRVMSGPNLGLLSQGLESYLTSSISLLVMTAALGAGVYLLANGKFGLQVRVSGASQHFGRALGVSVTSRLSAGLAFTNGLAGISGGLLAAHQRFADIGMGQGVLVIALAGLSIGERLVPSRWSSRITYLILAAIVGSVAYQIALTFALRLGVASSDFKLVTALLVLVVIWAGRRNMAGLGVDEASGRD